MGIETKFTTEEWIDRMVIECYYCHKEEAVEIHYNEKQNWSMYECLNKDCTKTYLMCWDDQKNWYNEQKGLNDETERL